jgi:hypothetical protein
MTAALPVDIVAGTREAVVATWSNEAIHVRYPSSRDGSEQPSEGFFDALADAQTVVDARGALIGRRFTAQAADIVWPDPTAGLPAVRLVDGEQAVDGVFICGRIEVDLGADTTSFSLFG